MNMKQLHALFCTNRNNPLFTSFLILAHLLLAKLVGLRVWKKLMETKKENGNNNLSMSCDTADFFKMPEESYFSSQAQSTSNFSKMPEKSSLFFLRHSSHLISISCLKSHMFLLRHGLWCCLSQCVLNFWKRIVGLSCNSNSVVKFVCWNVEWFVRLFAWPFVALAQRLFSFPTPLPFPFRHSPNQIFSPTLSDKLFSIAHVTSRSCARGGWHCSFNLQITDSSHHVGEGGNCYIVIRFASKSCRAPGHDCEWCQQQEKEMCACVVTEIILTSIWVGLDSQWSHSSSG